MYYRINFIINGNTNANTIVKAENKKIAEKELKSYWKKLDAKIKIVDIEESSYMSNS